MFELWMIIAAIVSLVKIAEIDDLNPWAWCLISVAAIFASMMLPLPLIRVFLAWVGVLVAMFMYRVMRMQVG